MSRSIAELERDRDHAVELARSLAGRNARIEFPDVTRSYAGKVLGERDGYLIQEHAGSGAVVVHDRGALSPAPSQDLTGKAVEIRYPHGNRVGVLRESLSEFDKELLDRERAARDEHGQARDGTEIAALDAKANAYAEARSLSGTSGAGHVTQRVLAGWEDSARREADYAVRNGDERHAAVMNARAGAFAGARATIIEGWERDVAVAERSFGADPDGRATTGRDGHGAVAREDRAGRAEPQGPELGDR